MHVTLEKKATKFHMQESKIVCQNTEKGKTLFCDSPEFAILFEAAIKMSKTTCGVHWLVVKG